MTTFFYIGLAINAALLLGGIGLSLSRVLEEFQNWLSAVLFLLAAWTAGAWFCHRADRTGLASFMVWLSAILLPSSIALGLFAITWLMGVLKGGAR
jgi:hypothetical protein